MTVNRRCPRRQKNNGGMAELSLLSPFSLQTGQAIDQIIICLAVQLVASKNIQLMQYTG